MAKANLLSIIALHKSEFRLHGLQPMISCHRISPSGEDRWVGSNETMVPTKLWLLGFELIGLHVLHDMEHPSHHIILCLVMGFIPLEYLRPCRHLS
jgi:hypothetical protein